MRGPKSKEHCENISKAQYALEPITCERCGFKSTHKTTMTRLHGSNCKYEINKYNND